MSAQPQPSNDWTPLHAAVHRVLQERQLAPLGQRLLVAVSGGQDSLCLMRLLLDLQSKWSWSIAIAHCNHGWRRDADANAASVQQLAQTWQVPYYSAIAQPGSVQTEAAARLWRYRVLTEIAIAHQFDRVVTGHTASDRAETLLYNLMRGSGTDGLTALAWQRQLTPEILLIRPLLNVTRSQTAAFCQAIDLPVWQDATNQDLHYARNRIRQELLPYLRSNFNPQVESHLAQTAEVLRAEAEYWDAVTQEWWVRSGGIGGEEGEGAGGEGAGVGGRVNRVVLRSADLAIQRRVVRHFLQVALGRTPTFAQIEKVVGLLGAPNRSQTDPFPGGAIARVESDWIVVRSRSRLTDP